MGPAASPGSGTRPNILFILTDDQRAEDTVVPTVMPKTLSWFASGGTKFPNAIATTPLCCPSRATIFSGRYAHNHNVKSNSQALNFDERYTIQRYLRDAGYQTGLVGQFLTSWPIGQSPLNWDRFWMLVSGYCPFVVNEQGVRRRYPLRVEPHNPANECFPEHLGRREDSPYATDYLAARAVEFVNDAEVDDARPWYLQVGVYAPHAPYISEADHRNDAVPEPGETDATFERDLSDKPSWVRGNQSAREGVFGDPTATPPYDGIADLQLRTLRSVDDLVDQLFLRLQATGELDNTLAVFIGDNGFYWGDHGLIAKANPYIQGLEVPFFMRFPPYTTAGSSDDRLVANVDLAPTALDAAGVTPQIPTDGRSLLDPSPRQRILSEFWRGSDLLLRLGQPWASTMTPDYHYIEHYTDDESAIVFRELYDRLADPNETSNLYGSDGAPTPDDPPFSPDPATLSSQLAADRTCSSTACP